jgi:hypothetical protein
LRALLFFGQKFEHFFLLPFHFSFPSLLRWLEGGGHDADIDNQDFAVCSHDYLFALKVYFFLFQTVCNSLGQLADPSVLWKEKNQVFCHFGSFFEDCFKIWVDMVKRVFFQRLITKPAPGRR